jgi:hypothetical protein
MMNERIEKLALDAGLLNYVDNETPRRCFIHGHADLEEVEKFAELIVRECIDVVSQCNLVGVDPIAHIKVHFGVK